MPPNRARTWARVALAGPVAVIASIALMLGMALWFPGGAAGIDHLVLPLILLPLFWAALFFHACLDTKLWRVAAVALLLIAVNGAMIAQSFLASPATAKGAAHV